MVVGMATSARLHRLEHPPSRRNAARIHRAMTYVDHFCRWTDETSAKADAWTLAQHFGYSSTAAWNWATEHVLPDVKAWRPSQDSSGVHTYQPGWFCIVSTPNPVSAIMNSTRLAFALDRDGPPYLIKNNIGPVITDIAVSPIFAGSHYPMGGYST